MINLPLLIAGSLFIIPFLIQLRIYLIIQSPSYLKFSLIFFFTFVDAIISSLELNPFSFQILLTLSFVATQFFLISIANEAIQPKIILSERTWLILAMFIFAGTILLKYLTFQGVLPPHYTSFRIAFGQFLQLGAGIMVIHSFINIKLVSDTKRNTRIQNLWIFAGIILVFNAVITILARLSHFIWNLIEDQENLSLVNMLRIQDNITTYSLLLLSLIILIFAINYPESLLLSMIQIYNAAKLYRILEKMEDEPKMRFFSDKKIIDYLEELPEDVVKKESSN